MRARRPAILCGCGRPARLCRRGERDLPRTRRPGHREVRLRGVPWHLAVRPPAPEGRPLPDGHRYRDPDLRGGDGARGVPSRLPHHAGGGRGVILRAGAASSRPDELRHEVRLGRKLGRHHRRRGSARVTAGRTAGRLAVAAAGPPILWVTVVLVGVAAALLPGFFSADNLANVLRQSAVLALLAIGQTFVVVAGMMDLSVGMLATLVLVLAADLMDGRAEATLAAVGLAAAVGIGVGALTGVLNNLLRINSLILTLGTLTILQGVTFIYTDQSLGAPSPSIAWLANGDVLGLPPSFLLVVLLVALAHLALHHTRFGVHLAAVGGAPQSARQAGIPVGRVQLAAFVISGLSAGLAGLVLLGRLGTGYPNAGIGLELDAIVAVVLGGTALAGGRGSVIGSVAAAVVLGIVSNMLNLLEVSSFVQMVIKGLVVIVVILIGQVRPERAA
ncbi:hypothetical protein CH340_02000 [Rhodoplanes serenus]|nr:hypothetical protein CH340_02000 [Rhodoplanes serenus]